jgi:Zn-dependent protease with chaperone function
MIAMSSAIGFFLVFVTITVAASAALSSLCLSQQARLRAHGPGAERSAAIAALVVPPVLAGAVTLSLILQSVLAPLFGHADHCEQHLQHLHLCVLHGESWGERGWAVAIVTGVSTWIAVSIVRAIHSFAAAKRGLARIEAIAEPIRFASTEVLLAPARIPFCFTAGLWRPRIYASSDAWSRWSDEERRAAIEHENAHIASHDLLSRLALGVFALAGAPLLAKRLLAMFDDASERVRDRQAAAAVGDPSVVASALLACARRDPPVAFCTSFLSSTSAERRIEALLSDRSENERAARSIARLTQLLTSAAIIAAIVFADPLHHAFESVLG